MPRKTRTNKEKKERMEPSEEIREMAGRNLRNDKRSHSVERGRSTPKKRKREPESQSQKTARGRSQSIKCVRSAADMRKNNPKSQDINRIRSNLDRIDVFTVFIAFNAASNKFTKSRSENEKSGHFVADSSGRMSSIHDQNNFTAPAKIQHKFFNNTCPQTTSAIKPNTTDITKFARQQILAFSKHPRVNAQQFPDIIFLSEEPKAKPIIDNATIGFPQKITLNDDVKYIKLGAIKDSIPKIRRAQNIAAYRLKNQCDLFNYTCKTLQRKVSGTTEKWLLVTKTKKSNAHIRSTVAGVHFTSKNTSATTTQKFDSILNSAKQFALINGVDYLLGDLNANSRGHSGGNHLVSASPQLMKTSYKMVFELMNSNSSNTKNYMGGLIVSSSVRIEPMNIQGLGGKMGTSHLKRDDGTLTCVTDHPSIAFRYSKIIPHEFIPKLPIRLKQSKQSVTVVKNGSPETPSLNIR